MIITHPGVGVPFRGMVSWAVLEEMQIPYVMETTPLRAYLRRAHQGPSFPRKSLSQRVRRLGQAGGEEAPAPGASHPAAGPGAFARKQPGSLDVTVVSDPCLDSLRPKEKSSGNSWAFQPAMRGVGRGEQVPEPQVCSKFSF